MTYSFTAGSDPTGGGAHTARTISWAADDGHNGNNLGIGTSTLDITHVPPTVQASGTVTFTGGTASSGPLDSGLTLAVVDSGGDLSSATVAIRTGFISGDRLTINGLTSGTINNGASGTITYAFSGSTLTLSGVDTKADYQAALDLGPIQ